MSILVGCGACGASGGAVVLRAARQPEDGTPFDLVRCVGCGLVRTACAEGDEQAYFDARYHGDRQGPTGALAARARVRWVQAHSVSGAWLDVGCGDGAVLAAARARGFRVVGVERGFGLSRAGRTPGLSLHDSIHGARHEGPFDVVSFFHSLQSFASPSNALRDAGRLLRPGGLLVIAVPAFDGLQARLFGRHWSALDVPRHRWHFEESTLAGLLRRHGFRPLRWVRGDLRYDAFGWVQSALDATTRHPHFLFRALSGERSMKTASARRTLALHFAAAGLLAPLAGGLALGTMRLGGAATLTVAARGVAADPGLVPEG